jgi:hypothetical protein
LTRNFDALPELIKKTVYDGNHIHVPRIEIAPLGSILQKSDRKAGTGISTFVGDRLMQWTPFSSQKVSTPSLVG